MNRIEDTLQTLRDIRLPEAARSRMRDELVAYAELHALPARGPVRSPFSILRVRMYAGLAAVLVIVMALGGTAYASERALPGDALYSVKVGIAEPLQTALVPSDQGRAAWHAILAERRLEEAAQLAERGSLSPAAQAELASNFDAQVTASQESADRLQHKGDTVDSLSVRSDLEARLSAHAQILSVIAAHYALASSTDAQNTHTALEHMLALVSDRQKTIVSTRLALEDAIAPNAAKDDASATSTAKIAVAFSKQARVHIEADATPAMQVETAAAVRTEEEQHILDRHASFLAKFLPISTTTATSTATTTATTTAVTATTTATTTVETTDTENLKN